MTLDFLKADLKGVFAEAQVYVALSRAANENGLELLGFKPGLVRCNWRALKFYEDPKYRPRLWSEKPLAVDGGMAEKAPPSANPGSLQGLTIVFTGEMGSFDRLDAEKLVEACGGAVRGSVSGKTNLLVAGDTLEDGRSVESTQKYKKAKEIVAGSNSKSNLRIIDKGSFFALIEGIEKAKNARASSSIHSEDGLDSYGDDRGTNGKRARSTKTTTATPKSMTMKSNTAGNYGSGSFHGSSNAKKKCTLDSSGMDVEEDDSMESEETGGKRARSTKNITTAAKSMTMKSNTTPKATGTSASIQVQELHHSRLCHKKQEQSDTGWDSCDDNRETPRRVNGKRAKSAKNTTTTAKSFTMKSNATTTAGNFGSGSSLGSKKEQKKTLNAKNKCKSDSSSSSDGEEETRRLLREKLAKKHKRLSPSSSDGEEETRRLLQEKLAKKYKKYRYSSSDDEEETRRLMRAKQAKKYKLPHLP